MKFKVQSNELVSMLKIIIKGHDPRDDSSFIYFKINDNEMKAVSSSQSGYFSGKIPTTGFESDDNDNDVFYVHGDVLRKLTGIFPDSPVAITFSVNPQSGVFVVKYTGHSFRLPIVTDTTELEEPATLDVGMIQASDFFTVLNSLTKILDKDPGAQEASSSCLHLSFKGDKMFAMGTDKYAIAEIEKEFTPDADLDEADGVILIQQAQASLLSKAINPAEVLRLVQTASSFGYIDGQGFLSLASKTRMEPVDYTYIKGLASDECSITTDYTDFKNTLDTIGKLSFSTDTSISLTLDKDKAQISGTNGDVMDLSISDKSGIDEEQTFLFIRTVLTSALAPVDTHSIRIQWAKPTDDNPAGLFQIVPINDDGTEEKNVFIGVSPNA